MLHFTHTYEIHWQSSVGSATLLIWYGIGRVETNVMRFCLPIKVTTIEIRKSKYTCE